MIRQKFSLADLRLLYTGLLVFLFIMLFTGSAKPQAEYFLNFGTVANSVDETQYFHFGDFAKANGYEKVDSIAITAVALGEADVDSVVCFPGWKSPSTANTPTTAGFAYLGATADTTFTCTINVDSNTAGISSMGSTGLEGDALEGYNSLKVTTRGAASGNDASDVGQNLKIVFIVYGPRR